MEVDAAANGGAPVPAERTGPALRGSFKKVSAVQNPDRAGRHAGKSLPMQLCLCAQGSTAPGEANHCGSQCLKQVIITL